MIPVYTIVESLHHQLKRIDAQSVDRFIHDVVFEHRWLLIDVEDGPALVDELLRKGGSVPAM